MAKKRLLFIDFLRFAAIYLMFWDHGIKLFYNFDPHAFGAKFLTSFSTEVLGITSLSSALFLFLVGFCLVLSFNRWKGKKTAWIWKKWKRGAILILLSYFLFFFKFNFEKMEAIATSGILQLIGLSLILSSLLFLIQRKPRVILVIFSSYSVLVTDFILRTKAIEIPLLNVYIFPLLPHIFYVFSGIILAEGFSYLKNFFWGSLLGIIIFIASANFNPSLIFNLRYNTSGFWQPSIILIIFNSLLITLFLSALAASEKKLSQINLIRKASFLGQEALNIYFFHILLGWGISKYLLKNAKFGFWASLLAVTSFLFLGWSWVKLKKIETQSSDPGLNR